MWTDEIDHVRHLVKQTKYLKRNPLRRWLIRHYLETIASLIEYTGVAELFDAGCGEGFVARYLSQYQPELQLAGMDIDGGVLAVAQLLNDGGSFVQGDVGRLPVQDDTYELVLCNEVLEHLRDPEQALREVKRITRHYSMFSVPREPHYRLANITIGANLRRWGDDPDHHQRWTRKQFVRFLERQFEVITVRQPVLWSIALCRVRPGK
jgi:ubiquinone/menaquinone biosynthesis C-methylase UbiE